LRGVEVAVGPDAERKRQAPIEEIESAPDLRGGTVAAMVLQMALVEPGERHVGVLAEALGVHSTAQPYVFSDGPWACVAPPSSNNSCASAVKAAKIPAKSSSPLTPAISRSRSLRYAAAHCGTIAAAVVRYAMREPVVRRRRLPWSCAP
jgi:hypothetical protein